MSGIMSWFIGSDGKAQMGVPVKGNPAHVSPGVPQNNAATKRTYAKRGANAAAKVYPQKLAVKATKEETGYVDLASNSYALDTTGSIVLIATVAQGASTSQRVGKKVQWKSIQCRGRYIANSTAQQNDCAMLVVYDKRPTGTLPAITDILVTVNPTAFNNDANSGRFQILKRVDFSLAGNSALATDTSIKQADFFLKVNRQAEFAAAGTGAIGDISLGALYLVTVGNNAAGTAAASMAAGFRTRFIDF